MTGVDRVELAYFERFLADDEPCWFLCRLPRSYALLDREGGQEVLARVLDRTPWGKAGFARLFAYSSSREKQRAIADVWRLAVGRSSSRRLSTLLKHKIPEGISYFNTGHSNLKVEIFESLSDIIDSKTIVFIHDLIPITSAEHSTFKKTVAFQNSLNLVSEYADAIIYNSEVTKTEAEDWFDNRPRKPPGVVAYLGVGETIEEPLITSPNKKPNFVMLGTIEPRKNHEMVLKIWQGFQRNMPEAETPDFHIIGRRGWENEAVFDILDNDPMIGKHVFEHNNLDDVQAQNMLAQSWGLLFPSFVEGFGLPLIEAARLGVPIFCGENALYREILGDYPLYLNVDNSYVWSKQILGRAGQKRESEAERQVRAGTVKIPTWDQHFDRIFRFV